MCVEQTFYKCGHTHSRDVRCEKKKSSLFCFWKAKSKPACYKSRRIVSNSWCGLCIDQSNVRVIPLGPEHVIEGRTRHSRDSHVDAAANQRVAELPSYALNDPLVTITEDPLAPPRPQRPRPATHLSDQGIGRSNARGSRPRPERWSSAPVSRIQPPERSSAFSAYPPPQRPSTGSSRHQRPQRGESLRQPGPASAYLDPTWAPPSRPGGSFHAPASFTIERGHSITSRHRRNSNESFVSAVSEGPMDPRSISPDPFDRR